MHDPELNLIDMKGRMYDPELGRFLTPDPVLGHPAGQGMNPYAYVENNPTNYVDPSGYEMTTLQGVGFGAFLGGDLALLAYESGWFQGGTSAGLDSSVGGNVASNTLGTTSTGVSLSMKYLQQTEHLNRTVYLGAQAIAPRSQQPGGGPTRGGGGAGRGSVKQSAVAPVQEKAPTPRPAAPRPAASNSEWGPAPDLSHTAGPYEAPPVPNKVLSNKEFKIEDTSETWRNLFEAVTILVPGPGEAEAGVVAASKLPQVLKGFTKHGLNQAISRDGVGVAARAILDAVKNPKVIIDQGERGVRYVGEHATVILNKSGKVISTWAHDMSAWRIHP